MQVFVLVLIAVKSITFNILIMSVEKITIDKFDKDGNIIVTFNWDGFKLTRIISNTGSLGSNTKTVVSGCSSLKKALETLRELG